LAAFAKIIRAVENADQGFLMNSSGSRAIEIFAPTAASATSG
jgi:hypothetical protein